MQVLVIGGSRFIGRAIVERLLAEGHRITLLNRGRSEDPFGSRVSRVLGDRSEPETLQKALAKRDFDAVVDVIAFREEDTDAAVRAFAGRIGHFLHVSTASVYLIRDRLYCPFREDDFPGRLAPRGRVADSSWLYAYHKRRCELALQSAWEEDRFPFTTLRLPMVVGPDDYTQRALAYLERLRDGGLNSWGFLWVEDVAEAVAANLMNAVAFGRAYNLAQREVVTVRQFVDTMGAAMGARANVVPVPTEWLQRVNLGTAFSPYTHDHDIILDIGAARRDLLFDPTPFAVWTSTLAAAFGAEARHAPSRLYGTRPVELRLVQELARLRIPPIAPTSASAKSS